MIIWFSFQSDLAGLDGKASTLESDHRRLSAKLANCQKSLADTNVELEEEKMKRKSETEILAKKLAELSKQVRYFIFVTSHLKVLRRSRTSNAEKSLAFFK